MNLESVKERINGLWGANLNDIDRREGRCLDLGCGDDKHEGCTGVDLVEYDDVDVVSDIEEGLPFEDDVFSEVFAISILEHLDDWVDAMKEVHRVCEDGAVIHVLVPHFWHPDAYTDPGHEHVFTGDTFEFTFEDRAERFGLEGMFEVEETHLHRNIWMWTDSIYAVLEVKDD